MKKTKIWISISLLLGLFLRIFLINQNPPSLNWDEVSHGFNAYSILKTGRDEWGSIMPLIFRCFGDFKLPLYIYLTVPSILFFGLNPFSVRLVSVIAGTLTPLIIYLILKKLTPSKKIIPFLGLLITLFSPGTIFLSRIALEANLFMFLFCLSLYFLISQKFGWSTFIFGLSLFSYNSSRVLLPFYLAALFYFISKEKINFKKIFSQFIPFIILASLAVYQTFNQSGQARYQWVSLLDSGSINQINELRQIYPRFLVNKATYFTFTAIKNYLSHFNPQFIFFNGGSHYQFSLPHFYIISPLLIPFFLLGLIYLIKNIRQLPYKLILFWLIISPIPSSITRDAPHILRSITFIPIIIIIISLGISYSLNKFTKLNLLYISAALILGQIFFWPKYFQYSKQYSSSWQYGYQQAVSYIKDNYQNYDQIIFTKKYGEPHEFILFYWPWNPVSYQNDPQKNWDYHANWYWVNAFDKFQFVNDWEIKQFTQNISSNQKVLLITSPNNYNQDRTSLLKSVNFLDQTTAFDILEIK